MRSLRAASRILAFLVVDGLLLPLALGTRVLHGAGARRSANRAAARVQRLWARTTLALLGVRVETRGTLPVGPHLLCANHVSYVDILVLGSLAPVRFVAKSEIAGWPLFGFLSRSVGTLFVAARRRSAILETVQGLAETLGSGTSVVLFPEGGASRGLRLERFHAALLEAPVRAGLPCLPVVLFYEPLGARAGAAWTACWWGGMELWRHAWRLAGLPGLLARVSLGEPVVGSERKELGEELRRRMETLFEPLSQEPVPDDLPWPDLARVPLSGGTRSASDPEPGGPLARAGGTGGDESALPRPTRGEVPGASR